MNLTPKVKTVRMEPDDSTFLVAAGSSDILSEYVDTAGYGGVRFLVGFGAITSGAATSIKVKQCDTSGGSYEDLAGTSQTVADTNDNKVFIVEITHPRERYLKVATLRATQNSAVDFLIAELFNHSGAIPITQHGTIVSNEIFDAPAEGTA
jgi:hypothetical protein